MDIYEKFIKRLEDRKSEHKFWFETQNKKDLAAGDEIYYLGDAFFDVEVSFEDRQEGRTTFELCHYDITPYVLSKDKKNLINLDTEEEIDYNKGAKILEKIGKGKDKGGIMTADVFFSNFSEELKVFLANTNFQKLFRTQLDQKEPSVKRGYYGIFEDTKVSTSDLKKIAKTCSAYAFVESEYNQDSMHEKPEKSEKIEKPKSKDVAF